MIDDRPAIGIPVRLEPEDGTRDALVAAVDDLFAAVVAVTERAASLRPVQRGVPTGWRNVVSAPQTTAFEVAGTRVDVDWLGGRDGCTSADRHGEVDGARAVAVEGGPDDWVVTVDHAGQRRRFAVATAGDRVDVDSGAGHLALRLLPRFTDPADAVAEGDSSRLTDLAA